MTSRRKFLTILGGGIVVAAGGSGAFLGTRTPQAALTPWSKAGEYDDPRMRALSYAILAPNPHNRQPWVVDLGEKDEITIWRDKTLNLPHTDPFDRQLTIGMGCFLELLRMAALETGHVASYREFPDGEDGPVAVVTFSEGGTPDPLFAHVLNRRSCKEPFEDRPLTQDDIAAISPFGTLSTSPEMVKALRELTLNAWRVEVETPHTFKESVDLMRIGKAEINANPDGIDIGGPFLDTLNLLGMLNREQILDPTSEAYTQSFDMYVEMLSATPAYVSLTTDTNDRAAQLAAGQRWLRLNLAATGQGLALHPVSQALQEFPEMAEHFQKAHTILAQPGETVQMLGRIGYGPQIALTPRWSLETKIKDG